MSRDLEMLFVLVAVAAGGVGAAIASKFVKDGGHWSVYYLAGMFTIATWTYMARRSQWPLFISSVAWDVAYHAGWFAMLLGVLHEPVTRWQVAGAGVVTGGLLLMGL